MELQEALMTTRAIRRYKDEPVSDEEVETCLKAAVQAPSGGNIQPWQFLVIRDEDLRSKVGEIYRRAYRRYEAALMKVWGEPRSEKDGLERDRMRSSARHLSDNIGTAPVIVGFLMPNISMTLSDDDGSMDTGTPYGSVFPAVQNFMLAARGLGIGTALTTVFRIHQEEVRKLLEIPDRYEIVALVPMGRPKGSFGVAPRRPAGDLTHWDRFGNKRTAKA